LSGASIGALEREGTVLLDGGMGSALIARGLEAGGCSELWNLERPDVVEAIHAAFLEAGSDVVQTNTFGGNTHALKRHGLADKMEAINTEGVSIARRAVERVTGGRGRTRLVAGNIGPSGAMLPPVGTAEPEALEDAFAAQAAVLVAAGADYLAIETMGDLREALCALRGARRATDREVTVCLTFDRKKRGFFTIMGDRPVDSMKRLADEGATFTGANCSIGSEAMVELWSALAKATPGTTIAKPNAGLPEMTAEGPVYRQTPAEFGRDLGEIANRGARIVGGCCGTDPRFIAELARAIGRDVAS